MRKDWRNYLVKAEEAEEMDVCYIVFEEDSQVGKGYDLTKGIFSDLEVAKEYADSMKGKESVFVAIFNDYEDGNYEYLYEVEGE